MRLDVYSWSEGAFLIDIQADLLSHLPTRLVVPLIDSDAKARFVRLNPKMLFLDRELTLMPQLVTTVDVRELAKRVGSVAEHDYRISAAVDMLLFGV